MFHQFVKHRYLLFLLICSIDLRAQEFIGLRTDNYAGSNGMLLNPATPMSGALPWDINIAAVGFSANNNYIYAPDQSTIALLNSSGEKIPVAFYHPQKIVAYENMMIQFPSAFVRINEFAVGLFFTARSAGYLKSDSYQPGVPSYDTIPFGVPTDFPALNAGLLNWSEIGVNGEFALLESASEAIYVGANLKYLMGYDGMEFDSHDQFTYTRGQTTSTVTPVDMDFAYSTNFGSNKMADLSNYQKNGNGVGLDAGVFYVMRSGGYGDKNSNAYNWKFGASLVDLGYIHFNKNSGDYHLSSTDIITVSTVEIDSIDDLDEFNFTGSRNLYDDGDASLTVPEFNMILPAAITLSADKNIGHGFFVSGLFVRRIPNLNSSLIARPNTIAISPRFEKRWFGFTLPVVLYDDKFLHIGTAARLGFLTIGSDNILSWFVKQEYTGTDIYAGIKINPIWLAEDSGKGIKGGKGMKGARQLECPKM